MPSEQNIPVQHQNRQPGFESEMNPKPQAEASGYKPSGKLEGRVALITGGDSGIGRATAYLFAKEGCDVSIVYKDEHQDAETTMSRVKELGRSCLVLPGDIADEQFCSSAVEKTVQRFGRLDILVNNAGEQFVRRSVKDVSRSDLEHIFNTNLFSMFDLVKASVDYLPQGGSIINMTSITAYKGAPSLLDYSATKGAILSYTRSLSRMLIKKGVRVNAVAPGPIWTPLIPASYPAEEVPFHGTGTPMKRAGQPYEVASCVLFLASDDASYINGQTLHPNGGEIVNG
ncbi:MAG: SDR family oxidoreductase [Chitinispirillaceae bacterium]